MPRQSDQSPAASTIRAAQAARLRQLREVLTPVQADAAREAGVSVFSWNRMETCNTDINAVALARFCAAYKVPAEYVVTGSYMGMPDAILPALVAGRAAQGHGQSDSEAQPSRAPKGKSSQKSSAGKARV